jgi:hypothetical protein
VSIGTRLSRVETPLEVLGRELNGFRAEVENRFAVPTWAVGINAAATIAILGDLLGH